MHLIIVIIQVWQICKNIKNNFKRGEILFYSIRFSIRCFLISATSLQATVFRIDFNTRNYFHLDLEEGDPDWTTMRESTDMFQVTQISPSSLAKRNQSSSDSTVPQYVLSYGLSFIILYVQRIQLIFGKWSMRSAVMFYFYCTCCRLTQGRIHGG